MYTKKEIESIVGGFKKEHYGRVSLPYNLHSKGMDRSETRDLIFSTSLKDKTVLDVGCAFGYMCFEAEQLGASRVVGIEKQEQRFARAQLFKKIKESKVDFLKESVFHYSFEETFDYVLFLNVLHHFKDPISLIKKAIGIAQEKLVIEQPERCGDGTQPNVSIEKIIEYCDGYFKKSEISHTSEKGKSGVSARRDRALVIFSERK